jgi:hypothetical protein
MAKQRKQGPPLRVSGPCLPRRWVDEAVFDGGSFTPDPGLSAILEDAVRQITTVPGEEDGGVLVRDPAGLVSFIYLANSLAGTPEAAGLYVPSPEEYGRRVVSGFGRGLLTFASIHVHPGWIPALPSTTDLTYLFRGFPENYIWAERGRDLRRYTYEPVDRWRMQRVLAGWIPAVPAKVDEPGLELFID